MLRVSLHPPGTGAACSEIAAVEVPPFFSHLQHLIDNTQDPQLKALVDELHSYSAGNAPDSVHLKGETRGVAMPFKLQTAQGVLSFISTITIFGSPMDITLQELALETFLPADDCTAQQLRAFAQSPP